jgi:hypothetical protein
VSGLGVQIYQQNAKLVRLGERQLYLAEKALKRGSGSGSDAEKLESEGVKKDKGTGKASEGVNETMKSDGGSDSDSGSEEEDDERMREYVGSAVSDLEKEK